MALLKFRQEQYRATAPDAIREFCHVRSAGHYLAEPGFRDMIMKKDFLELFWCADGSGNAVHEGKVMKISAGDVFCYLPGDEHQLFADRENWEYYWLTIDGPDLPALIWTFGFSQTVRHAGACPVELFNRMILDLTEIDLSGVLQAGIRACEILSRAANPFPAAEEDLVSAFKGMTAEEFDHPDFSIAQAAQRLAVHRSTLHRVFTAKCGISPQEYLSSFRLQRAVSLLGRNYSVKEAAALCGFSSQNYFARVFRVCFGKSPAEFRRTMPHTEFF